ncbi:RyR domain-containing protein [Roseovarius nitratireducens]|uniref:RyR domain-containing protein n=1 Tax=Roseovarius nitratireducens TaxID=2044597 RepID=UPI00197CF471|nr:RyR domain-containing protein [Roseovarius nitratireducens]
MVAQDMNMARIEDAAQLAHEVNRAFCASMGDGSQPRWNDAPDWQRESAIQGVRHAFENPHASPEDSHNNWMAQKARDGWRFGLVKDERAKEHPCMVRYDQLSPTERVKDALFLAVVRTYLALDHG